MDNISRTALDLQFFKGDATAQIGNILNEVVTSSSFSKLDEDISDGIKHCLDVTQGTEKFIEEIGSNLSPLQLKVIKQTQQDPKMKDGLQMLSGGIVGQFLKMTAEMTKAECFLDIGTYTGFSAVTMADTKYCKSVVSLDINEYSKVFVDHVVKGTPIQGKINVFIGPAIDSLQKLKDEGRTFDFVFIDADKQSYITYYKFILDNGLLNANGVIVCDNMLWSNDTITKRNTAQGKALYDFAYFVKNDQRVEQLILPYRDGLLVVRLLSN